MALIFRYLIVLCTAFLAPGSAWANLFTAPVLRIDPGVHTGAITRADMDAAGRFVVTASIDRTVRVWSAVTGRLIDTLSLPIGDGDIGKAYAVAISPDGALIAAGGRTRWSQSDRPQQIYIFDRIQRQMVTRIEGLPDVVPHLAFSPDGSRLLAMLGGANGMRLFSPEDGTEIAADQDYGNSSFGASFAADGRFATSSFDGNLRLYGPDGTLKTTIDTGHALPYGVAFHPHGDLIAVGYSDGTWVDVFSAKHGTKSYSADTSWIGNGNLFTVAWSVDGRTLYAGANYYRDERNLVLSWSQSGRGPREQLPGGRDALMSLLPLAGGDVVAAANDPWMGRISADGTLRWQIGPVQADFRGQERKLLLSRDGLQVGFGYGYGGRDPAWFDIAALALQDGLNADLAAPDHSGPSVTDWEQEFDPKLDGKALDLEQYEISRSLSIAPDGRSFTLGTDWYLRRYNATGAVLWQRAAPGAARAVNHSADGRYIVAAYGDGTIRWHRPEDGAELLAFFPFADKTNFVLWTPSGYHYSTPGADQSLRWHKNLGWNQIPARRPVSANKGYFAPELIKLILQVGDEERALERLAARQPRRPGVPEDKTRPFNAHLHVLTIGVSAYRDHPKLALDYADNDAADLATRLLDQQLLYTKVNVEGPLVDDQADRRTILHAMRKLKDRMRSDKEDVAVISFSGHGTRIGDDYYLLPHDVDASSEDGIEDTAIHIDEVIRRVRQMAQLGKVIVLLDACHSGSVIDGGRSGSPPDITQVQDMLVSAGNGAVVITSSTGQQVSREDPMWENGAFTEVVLEALSPAGDANDDGWVSLAELRSYVVSGVRALTNSRQIPTIRVPDEKDFEANLFQIR